MLLIPVVGFYETRIVLVQFDIEIGIVDFFIDIFASVYPYMFVKFLLSPVGGVGSSQIEVASFEEAWRLNAESGILGEHVARDSLFGTGLHKLGMHKHRAFHLGGGAPVSAMDIGCRWSIIVALLVLAVLGKHIHLLPHVLDFPISHTLGHAVTLTLIPLHGLPLAIGGHVLFFHLFDLLLHFCQHGSGFVFVHHTRHQRCPFGLM